MTGLDVLRDSILAMSSIEPIDDGFTVATHCLYPSNAVVRVSVHGREREFIVTDEGGATDEAASMNLRLQGSIPLIAPIVRRQGLKFQKGVIFSPPLPAEAVGPAVLLVANASKEAAYRLLDHLRVAVTRNFRQALTELLQRTFHQELRHDLPIIGASNKPHKFDHVVELAGGRRLLIDPVSRESTSINARVVANLDVRNAGNSDIIQRIIFDDHEKWPAADLNLLQIGAPVVPFSQTSDVLVRLIAA